MEIEEKKKKLILLIIIVLVVGGGIWLLGSKREPQELAPSDPVESTEATSLAKDTGETSASLKEESTTKKIYVDMKGEVKHPGMYPLQEGDRVYDAIQAAGGLTKAAEKDRLDLAQKVQDEMTVIIPKKGEKKKDWLRYPKGETSTSQTNSSSAGGAKDSGQGEEGGKISVNQATSEQLQTIDGIGEKKAQKIIQYREEKGQIQSLDELQNIDGFGEKTVEKLKKALVL